MSNRLNGNSAELMRTTFARTRLFASWPADAIERLCIVSQIRCLSDGQLVMRADDSPQGLVIVAEGLLESSRGWANGRRVVFDYHMPGQILGIVPVCDRQRQIFDVVARGPADILFVPDTPFLAVLNDDPALMRDVIVMLCRRTRVMYSRIEMDVLNSLRGRIAKLLLYFARGSQTTDVDRLAMRVSQDNLASLLGVSRQSVNRELAPLIKSGVLARRYRGIEILDFDRLLAAATEEESLSLDSKDILHGPPPALHRTTD